MIFYSGEDARASRTRTALRGSMALLAARTLSFTASFVTVAFLSRHLSRESFGLWAITSTFAFFASSFDFGLGQGMRNRLAAGSSTETGQPSAERDIFLSVLLVLLVTSAVVSVVLLLVFPHLPWSLWFGAQGSSTKGTVSTVITTAAVCFVISMPLGLSYTGFMAYQEAGRRSLFDGLQSLMLVGVTIGLSSRVTIAQFIAAYYIAFDLSELIALLAFMHRRHWTIVRIPLAAGWVIIRGLIRNSLQFWVLGIAALMLFTTDPIIAGRVLGLEQAGDFNVVQRLFTAIIVVHFTLLTPLWSAYTQAAEIRDWAWIARMLGRSVRLTAMLTIVGTVIIATFSGPILDLWVGREINDKSLVFVFMAWTSLFAFTNCLSVLLNGVSRLRRQTIFVVVAAISHVPLSLWLGSTYGAAGVAMGSAIAVTPLLVSNITEVSTLLKERAADSEDVQRVT